MSGIRDELAKIPPHEIIKLTNRNIARATPFFLMGVDGMPFAVAEIIRMRPARDPNTGSSTEATTHEGFQQIGVGGIVAPG